MKQHVLTLVVLILGIPLTALGLYLLVRVVSSGYYRSKKEFYLWYTENVRKPNHGERRKSDRRESEQLLP